MSEKWGCFIFKLLWFGFYVFVTQNSLMGTSFKGAVLYHQDTSSKNLAKKDIKAM
jgi:hypothetical protein